MHVAPPKHVLWNSSKVSFAHVSEIQTTSEFGHRVLTLPPPTSVLTLTRLDVRRIHCVDSETGFRTPSQILYVGEGGDTNTGTITRESLDGWIVVRNLIF